MNRDLQNHLELMKGYVPPPARAALLNSFAAWLREKQQADEAIRLNFICTHNSRRSHLAQIWAQALGFYFDVKNLSCYSGGTEVTALFPQVATTLQEQGFDVRKLIRGSNPVYAVKFDADEEPVICFSKKYDDPFNPKGNFAAVMTCSGADLGCPVVAGAEKRFALTFEDPKASDGTPEMEQTYFNRSLEIATELYYVFSKL